MKNVVIVGGGFGGLYAARALRRVAAHVTVIDRRNFHLFQPLLYQVATGTLSPADIAYPLRSILKRHKNTRVVLGEVVDIDTSTRDVVLRDGERFPYDELVVATGSVSSYFGHDTWREWAPGLKSVEDATAMRQRILMAFEAAEREPDAGKRKALLTFVVIGAGPTGVELAGALGEIAKYTLRDNFRSIDPSDARVLLIEGAERVLPSYPAELSASSQRSLAKLGVTVSTSSLVEDVSGDAVEYRHQGDIVRVPARTVLWTAGVEPSPLAKVLAERAGAELDRSGRVRVDECLRLPHDPTIRVIGDMAHCPDGDGNPLPGVAPVAIQQGAHVAESIGRVLEGEDAAPFRYKNRGAMATIGRSMAVADLGWLRFSGTPAWLAWLLVHILYLIEFENRAVVLTRWAWNYFTWNRGARLITGRPDGGRDSP